MASEMAPNAINGNYSSQQAYDHQLQAQAANSITGSGSSSALGGEQTNTLGAGNANSSSTTTEGNSSVPKDEVGWYFVEQYYTTLSKNPEKLHVSFMIPQ